MIKFTDDLALKQEILKAIKENNGYCPCRIEHTADTKCMCKEFRNMEEGTCHCGLYVKTKETNK